MKHVVENLLVFVYSQDEKSYTASSRFFRNYSLWSQNTW